MPEQQGHLRGVPVLLVERDSFCASYVGSGLEAAGAQVLGPYASADEALASIARASPAPAVAVLGIGDGGLDGVADALTGQRIPYLLMNRSQDAEPEPCCEGHLCFCKPFGAFQIVEAVEHMAAQPR
jgi:hypothetical protein